MASELFNRFDLSRRQIAGLSEEEKNSIIQSALRILDVKASRKGSKFESPEPFRQYLRLRHFDRFNEVFGAIFLDNQHRILQSEELFQGTVDGAAVHHRVVAQRALELNAVAVVFWHNHPSGVAEPSDADVRVTKKLKEVLGVFDIRVLDHFIVATDGAFSLAEQGLL